MVAAAMNWRSGGGAAGSAMQASFKKAAKHKQHQQIGQVRFSKKFPEQTREDLMPYKQGG